VEFDRRRGSEDRRAYCHERVEHAAAAFPLFFLRSLERLRAKKVAAAVFDAARSGPHSPSAPGTRLGTAGLLPNIVCRSRCRNRRTHRADSAFLGSVRMRFGSLIETPPFRRGFYLCLAASVETRNLTIVKPRPRGVVAGGHCPSIYGIPLLGSVSFLGIRFRISARASNAISQDLSMNSSPRGVELISFLISD
jgi:hypothetical protein